MITVIIPIRNEELYISNCLDSIVLSKIKDIEILIIDGMSSDKTRDIIQEYIKKYPQISLLDNVKLTVPHAMNIGIKNAKGDVIIRLDGHASFPENYISDLLYWQEKLNADNVGAMVETLAGNNTLQAEAIALAMSSSFGMGNSYFRVGVKSPMEVDTVPFGCYKKEVFDKIGLYDEELIRNEDDELNARLIESGGKIYLIPNIKIKYFTRENLKKTTKMFYQYGYLKPLVNLKIKSPATLRQFVPPLFTLFIIIGTILSLYSETIFIIYISTLFIYLILSFITSYKTVKKVNRLQSLLMLSFFVIHLSYGFGYIKGVVDFMLFKKHKKSGISISNSYSR